MSFIKQDKNLIEKLLKIAQVNQTTPAAPTPNNVEVVKNLALKLVNNLNEHIGDNASEFTAEKSDANLNTKALQTFDSLLNFLQYNGLATGGKKLVLRNVPSIGLQAGTMVNEYDKLSQQDKSLYSKYPDVDDDNFQYWVYKNGLISYLQDLQEKSKDNPILLAYVSKRIEDAKNELDIQIKNNDVSKVILFDTVPRQLNAANPTEESSNGAPLTSTDLASKNSFAAWFQNNKIVYVNGAAQSWKDFTQKGGQICQILGILYERASNASYRSDSDEAKQYAAAVLRLSQGFQCSVSSSNNQNSTNQNTNYQTVGYVTKNGGFTDEGIATLSSNFELPLVQNFIIVDRIDKFTQAFKNMTNASITDSVIKDIDKLKNTYSSITSLNLSVNSFSELDNFIKNHASGGNGYEYLLIMNDLLQSVQQMLGIISRMCELSGTVPALNFKSKIDQQISNVYQSNMAGLRTLMAQMNKNLPGKV